MVSYCRCQGQKKQKTKRGGEIRPNQNPTETSGKSPMDSQWLDVIGQIWII